jgi:hypothetical protein
MKEIKMLNENEEFEKFLEWKRANKIRKDEQWDHEKKALRS